MTDMMTTADAFFVACETGKGWDGCAQYCHPKATFAAQTAALDGVDTLEGYCEWMVGLLKMIPDGTYDLKGFAADDDRSVVLAFAVFSGQPVDDNGDPAGGPIAADYVYAMHFDGGKISHMTKVWNDQYPPS